MYIFSSTVIRDLKFCVYFSSKPVQYIERMRPGSCQMICAAWSPGGAFLAAGSADHHVRVYMMSESGPRRILEVNIVFLFSKTEL